MTALFAIFGIPLGWIMHACYLLFKNYGLALITFTIITKLVLLPLAIKQQKGMVKMAMFKPKIDEIQQKYKNNPQKQQEELGNLYTKEGYNPMSGCLPTLVQFPILFGLINVIYYPLQHILRIPKEVRAQAIEIAKALPGVVMNNYSPEMGVISALKANPDAFSALGGEVVAAVQNFDFTFFGLDMGAVPSFHFDSTQAILLLLIPVLSGLSSFYMSRISMKMSTAAAGDSAASMNASMMIMMPLMSAWIAFTVPAGVGIYWVLSNLLMIIQQRALYKFYNPTEMAEKAKAELEAKRELERAEKIEARKQAKEGKPVEVEKALSQKEINRLKLAAARKRDAEKYGEEYVEVTDEDVD